MKKQILITFVSFAFVGLVNAQIDSVFFYPSLNPESTTSSGFSIQDVEKPIIEEKFWWDTKYDPPNDSILDYNRVGPQQEWRIRGYDKSNYFEMETWFVLDPIDMSDFSDVVFTFYNQAMYALGLESDTWFSKLELKVSTDYSDDITSATWIDHTPELDTIDQHLNYDVKWVKSTLNMSSYSKQNSVTVAFKIHIDQNGSVTKNDDENGIIGERPGSWTLAEMRFTGNYDPSIAINERAKNRIEVYPNPVMEYLHFNIEAKNILVYNITGQQVPAQLNQLNNSIDVSELCIGTYFVKLEDSSGEIYISKFIKK